MATERNETFRVTFHYTIEVDAANADDAEEMAARELDRMLDDGSLRPSARDMAATVNPAGE